MPGSRPTWHDDQVTNDESPADRPPGPLPGVAQEVESFVAGGGWDQPPQLFALVPTGDLVACNPELAGQVDTGSALTPVAQERLPADDVAEALATISWSEAVHGCALAQEIVVLPPEAEDELRRDHDSERARALAAAHPQRREARLVAAVLRGGEYACVLRLRGTHEAPEQIVEHPELAPNLTAALLQTLQD